MFSSLEAQEEETEMDNSKQGVQARTEGKVWHGCGREKQQLMSGWRKKQE